MLIKVKQCREIFDFQTRYLVHRAQLVGLKLDGIGHYQKVLEVAVEPLEAKVGIVEGIENRILAYIVIAKAHIF